MGAMLAAYSQPHRKYHTLQHLGECLTLTLQFSVQNRSVLMNTKRR
jgi:predicted metal-dependent HD superfamily phosphohydrolase